jgi:hypothetical protein
MASADRAPLAWPEQQALFSFHAGMCARCPVAQHFGGPCPGAGSRFACTPKTLNPAHEHFAELLAEIEGLEWGWTEARPQPRLELPSFIPQIDGTGLGHEIHRPWVAIRLRDWRRRTEGSTAKDLHEALNLDQSIKILLLLFDTDYALDVRLWPHRHRFLDSLERWRPDAIAGPDYSVWRDWPLLEREYSIVKSLRFLGLAQERGIPAIPNVFWGDDSQMDRWSCWLNNNSAVELITMDLQCLPRSMEPRFVAELTDFHYRLERPPALLVAGVAREGLIRGIQSVWSICSFTANTFIQPLKRRATARLAGGRFARYVVPGGDPEALMRAQVELFESVVNERLCLWPENVFGQVPQNPRPLAFEPGGLWVPVSPLERRGYWMPKARRRSVGMPEPALPAPWLKDSPTWGIAHGHRGGVP